MTSVPTNRFSAYDFSKDHVFVVQMWRGTNGDEELRAIRVWACICLCEVRWLSSESCIAKAEPLKAKMALCVSSGTPHLRISHRRSTRRRSLESNGSQSHNEMSGESESVPFPAVKSPPWHINLWPTRLQARQSTVTRPVDDGLPLDYSVESGPFEGQFLASLS